MDARDADFELIAETASELEELAELMRDLELSIVYVTIRVRPTNAPIASAA